MTEKLNRPPTSVKESTKWKHAELFVPWILSIIAFLFAVVQFSLQQQAANRSPFLEKQLEITFEAADAAAVLATTTDMDIWKDARRKFMRLKFGQLRIVEDRELSLAMADFWENLPDENDTKLRLPLRRLEQRALKIAERSRDLIGRGWDVDLEPLVEAPPKRKSFLRQKFGSFQLGQKHSRQEL